MTSTLSLLFLFLFWLKCFSTLSFFQPTDICELYRFLNGTWLENTAVRPNGNLLVADSTGANL